MSRPSRPAFEAVGLPRLTSREEGTSGSGAAKTSTAAARSHMSTSTICLLSRWMTAQGNTEGTPARVRASSRSYSSALDPGDLRGFRGRQRPRSPSLPASALNGKEGVDGSSPSEGLEKIPAKRHIYCCLSRRQSGLKGNAEGTFRDPLCMRKRFNSRLASGLFAASFVMSREGASRPHVPCCGRAILADAWELRRRQGGRIPATLLASRDVSGVDGDVAWHRAHAVDPRQDRGEAA